MEIISRPDTRTPNTLNQAFDVFEVLGQTIIEIKGINNTVLNGGAVLAYFTKGGIRIGRINAPIELLKACKMALINIGKNAYSGRVMLHC